MKNIFILLFIITPVFLLAQNNDSHLDYNVAAKYELNITGQSNKLDPAPEWLRNLDMIFTDWSVKANMLDSPYKLWKGYRVELKDTLVERIVRIAPLYSKVKIIEQKPITIDGNYDGSPIDGVKLLSHVPHSKKGFEQAHKQGFKVIPYVHFTDIHSYYADQEVFLFEHPEILLRDEKGKWVHLQMDGTERMFRFLTCANNPSYWKLSLSYIKKLMDWGADGLFIDNVGERKSCYASNFNKLNPEFDPYVHEHLFQNDSHNYAYGRFLQTVRSLVKSYGDDKIIILNSGLGTEFQKDGDCNMLESFIYSWAWEGRAPNQTWTDLKKVVKQNGWYLNAGRSLTGLSYLDTDRKEVKEDAFWVFSVARLLGIIWWANLEDTGAEILYKIHTGKSIQPLKEIDKIAYRTFENCVIVLNDGSENKRIELDLPSEFQYNKLTDIFDNEKVIIINNSKIIITVPPKKARIFLYKK